MICLALLHEIPYLAVTMNYGLGSDDPEELAYYKKIIKEIDDMKKDPTKERGNSKLEKCRRDG